MMDKKGAWLLLFVTFSQAFSQKTVHQQVVATTKEQVNGHLFVYTYQIIDGITREAWAIDGQSVDKASYEDTILEAEKAERRRERQEAYAAQMEELSAKQRMQQGLLKKMLKKEVAQLQKELNLIPEYALQPYLAFGEASITQEQYDELPDLFGQVNDLLQQEEPALSELQALTDRIASYEKRLKKLIHRSIEAAIAQCDDTAMLKKLLALTA